MAPKSVDETDTEATKMERLKMGAMCAKRFVYHDGQVFERTCCAWIKSLAYLLVFYSVLIFGICWPMLIGLNNTLVDKPRYYGPGSFTSGHPAMFEPNPIRKKRLALWWHSSNEASYAPFVLQLKSILDKYVSNRTSDMLNCSNGEQTRQIFDGRYTNKSCWLDPTDENTSTGYGPCHLLRDDEKYDNTFGFKLGKPCIMLRLNKMLGYYPKAIDNYNDASIPEDVRNMHNDFIGSLNTINESKCLDKPSNTNCFYRRIYFSCHPEVDGNKSIGHDHDVKIDYYPKYGIPFCYYPYWRQNPYHAPFIMAQFTNLQPGKLFTFVCGPYTNDSLESLKHSQTRIHIQFDSDTTEKLKVAEKFY